MDPRDSKPVDKTRTADQAPPVKPVKREKPMQRFLRRLRNGVVLFLVLVLLIYAGVYALSERELQRVYDSAPIVLSVPIPTDAESIAEGKRLATIRGCANACHGKTIEGNVMFDQPMLGKLVAPNLTRVVREYDDSQLATFIRGGLRADGRSMMVMPSMAFTHLSDEDLSRIIAWLRSVPEVAGPRARVELGPLGRLGVVMGKFKTMKQTMIDAPSPPPATNKDAQLGRYLAQSACAECHGTDLRGADHGEFIATSLQIAKAYSAEQFTALMRTGVAIGGRDNLPMMSRYARENLSAMNDAEIAALYAYLHELPDAPASP
jgi:mono/diheme cytochrome c family protein